MKQPKILKDPFISMLVYTFLGGVSGIFIGLILSYVLAFVAVNVTPDSHDYTEFTLPAMVFGVIIGGTLGGIVGIRKAK